MPKKYWLMKTEPDTFSFDDLVNSPKKTDHWDGIRNYQARNMMRDEFQLGDEVFIYHSRTTPPAIVGIAEVVKTAYPDHTALDESSPYFDPKSVEKGESRWVMVDVKAMKKLTREISIQDVRDHPKLQDMPLIKRGQRLSIQPVSKKQWDTIVALGAPKKV